MYSLQDLINSETGTLQQSRQFLPGVSATYPQILDLLLAIPQLIDKSQPELDLTESTYYFYGHYPQAHATATCTFRCFETGYYLEATILTRHLAEAFVQMRYFKCHPGLLQNHIVNKHRVSFHTMFETFSPGYYEQYYGQFLSEAAHGIAYKLLMRTYGPVQQDGGRLVLGNHFDSGIATLIINGLTAVLSGYFNFVNEMLPRNLIAANLEVSSKFEGLKGWLNHAIEALESSDTELRDLYRHYLRLYRLPAS